MTRAIWIPKRLYHLLPWAALTAGLIGVSAGHPSLAAVLGQVCLTYGAAILLVRWSWFGSGEVQP